MGLTTQEQSSLHKIKMNNIRVDLKKISARADAAIANGEKPFFPPVEEILGPIPQPSITADFDFEEYASDLKAYYSTAASIEAAFAQKMKKIGS